MVELRNVRIRNRLLMGVAVAGLVAAFSGSAIAQTTPAPAPAPVATEDDEKVVVTARRREEVLKDVPIAVTSLNQGALQERLIFSTSDLANFTPGFQFNEAFGRDGDRPVIRGASNILISEGKVGVFLDGAPIIGDSTGIDLRAFRRIEVIRGPQAAVYGRGTQSGAINYVSARPGEKWEGQLEGTVGSFDRYEAYAGVSGPIFDYLGMTASYRYYDFGGDYTNTVTGQKLGEQNTETFNVALFFDPVDNLSVDVRYIFSQDDDGHFAVALLPGSANNCFLTTRPFFCGTAPSPQTFAINTPDIRQPGLQRETHRYFANVSLDVVDGYQLKYQFSAADQHEVSGYDQSYDSRSFFIFAGCPVFIQNRLCTASPFNDTGGGFTESQSHEVRFESPSEKSFRWRVGFFGLQIERRPDLSFLEITQSGGDGPGTITTTDSIAFFGGIDFDITDALTVGAELRYQEDEIDDQGLNYRFGDVFPVPPAALLGGNPNQVIGNNAARSAKFHATLPRVTASYRVNEDVSLYAQYAVGNSPGGFNSAAAPSPTFDEETLTNYEIGIKTSVWGFDYLNLSLFTSEIENQVLTNTFVSGATVDSFRANVGVADIQGLEIEFQRKLFDFFKLSGTYSYIDGEYSSGAESNQALFVGGAYCATGSNPNTTLTTPAVTVGGVPINTPCLQLASIVGKKPPLVSPHLASLTLDYNRPIGGGYDIFAIANVTYRDSFYAQVDNLIETGSATKVNAQIGVENDKLRVSLWGRNLFESDTPEGILRYVDFLQPRPPGLPGAPGFQGTPRAFAISPPHQQSFGLTVGYKL